jgi:hypothetical protein
MNLTKAFIFDAVLYDFDISTDDLMAGLAADGHTVSRLVVQTLRSDFRDVVRYLREEGLLVRDRSTNVADRRPTTDSACTEE